MVSIHRVIAVCLIAASTASGQQRPVDSLTGQPYRFPINESGALFWSNSPLRESLASLSKTRKVPIWLDRRCDPSQRITFASGDSLRDSLWRLAEQEPHIDIAWSPEIIFVGPGGAADRWATTNLAHRDMLRRLPLLEQRRWLKEANWKWDRLTNPQDLLKKLEREIGQKILGREKIQHDLWPAARFPDLPLYLRLELLLAGYSKTFVVANGTVRIVDMPKEPLVNRRIPQQAEQRQVRDLLKQFPKARLAGKTLQTSWRVHEAIRRAFAEESRISSQNLDGIRFTLSAQKQPVGPLVSQLAKQLGLDCQFSESAQEKFDAMVTFDVEEGSFKQLMKEVLEPAQLTFTIKNRNLTIVTAAEQAAQR